MPDKQIKMYKEGGMALNVKNGLLSCTLVPIGMAMFKNTSIWVLSVNASIHTAGLQVRVTGWRAGIDLG